MRIISGVGYYATGSGVIQDLCKEFSSCEILSDYEVRFLQDPDGISDLQYNLVDNNHRHNTSFAVKRFLKYMKFLNGSIYSRRYRKFFGEDFWPLTLKYVAELTELKANTWWHRDQIEKGKLFYFFDIIYCKVINKILGGENASSFLKGREVNYYTYIRKDEFLSITKGYLYHLFNTSRKMNKPYLFVNQLISPSNVDRYIAYFDDIRVVIVERDPRDLYIAEREIYHAGVIPVKTVEEFCIWYSITRRHRKFETYNHEMTLFVHFEDLIYRYDEMLKIVMDFVGFCEEDHIYKKNYFNPQLSIKGTQLVKKFPRYSEDVKYIEEKLSEYLYKFPNT